MNLKEQTMKRLSGKDNRNTTGDIYVLFIIPPVLRFLKKSSSHLPLGCGYMVSYLKKHGINSLIYNADRYRETSAERLSAVYNFLKAKVFGTTSFNVDFAKKWPMFYSKVNELQGPVWNEVRRTLKMLNPKIVGISSKVVDIPSTFILANVVKETLPKASVVVGGPSASTCTEYLMQQGSIDFLVLGEGEEAMLELAEYIINKPYGLEPKDIRGLTYRDGGKVVSTQRRPLIENLNDIPFPDRESMFVINAGGSIEYVHECRDVLMSRGCPYPCTFCGAFEAWGSRKPRFRSIDNVIAELKYLKNVFNQRYFIFWDDLFTVSRNRTMEFCEKIMQNNLDIKWTCVTRLNTLDSELLEYMKRAGCVEVQIGIESGNDRILKYIKKGLTLELIRRQTAVINKSGINWRIFLIIGFPTETMEEMGDTLKLISEINPTFVDLSIFSPYPGTDLYYELKEKGSLGKDFMKSDMWYPYNNYTGTMTNEEFQKFAFNAFKYVDGYKRKAI